LRLVVGKENIENYENTQRGLTNDSMDCAQPTFMWKDAQGVAQPAIVVFEVGDFAEDAGGMTEHGNEYHSPDFAEASALLAHTSDMNNPHGTTVEYMELMQELSPSGTGWRTYDLSGYGVPANATCELILSNSNASSEYMAGARAVGSALNRTFDLQEAESGGRTFVTVHVKADANSQVQGYAENATYIRFILVGYWS
jgi:hypothetical protein